MEPSLGGCRPGQRRGRLGAGQQHLGAGGQDGLQGLLLMPIVCLDDLASELDIPHQQRVLEALLASGAQLLLTATESPPVLANLPAPARRFHVEQGRVAVAGG